MQAIKSGSEFGVSPTDNNANGNGCRSRSKTDKKNNGSRRNHYSFLNIKFSPVCNYSINCEGSNLLTNENYEFLYNSYAQYAKLLGKEVAYKPKRTDRPGTKIAELYHEFAKILNREVGLNIEYYSNRLVFMLWKAHGWENYNLYWFPVKFLEYLNPKLRRITITFLHDFISSNNISTLNNYEDSENTLCWLQDSQYDAENNKEQEQEIKDLIERYDAGGNAYMLMDEIEKNSYYKNLPSALHRYKPQNEFEKGLVALLQKGLMLIGKNKPAINDYSYDPYLNENDDYLPVQLSQQIMLIYDNEDIFTEALIESLNINLSETYDLPPITEMLLSPQTDKLFSMDDYPEKFLMWSDNFISHIRSFNYE